LSEIQSLDEAMAAAASDGVLYAQERFGIALDYSTGSMERLEELLTNLYNSIPRGLFARLTKPTPSAQDMNRIAMMLGGYIGEVIRKNAGGGTWTTESEAFPGEKVMTFRTTGGLDLWPHARVLKRLENGPEDNVWHYFQVLRKQLTAA
jgi:hypothetical protein